MEFEMFKTPEEFKNYPGSTPIQDFYEDLNKRSIDELNSIFTKALKRKGFVFKHPNLIAGFAKERCRCDDNKDLKQKTYYVDDIPFLQHNYQTEIRTRFDPNASGPILIASIGSFAYL